MSAGRKASDRTLQLRLRNHLLAQNPAATPVDVVSHYGAVQAQDYLGALWAIALRTRSATEADVERAIAERRIIRCWPMRGTLHFVPGADARWMLELLAPRVLAQNRARLEREFGIDARTLRRSRTVIERALHGSDGLTRPELYAVLAKSGIAVDSSRGLHILFALAHERLLCFGARKGKQPTFVLFDEWVPPAPPRKREESLAELARRYLAGHAPATAADFAWWSGLTIREAKEGFALAEADLDPVEEGVSGRRKRSVHLLPPFDEYTVAYRDRSAVIDPAFTRELNRGGGMLSAIVVVNGTVEGTWKRYLKGSSVEIEISTFRPLGDQEHRRLEKEGERYRRFLGAGSLVLKGAR